MAEWIQAGALVVVAVLYAVRSIATLRMLAKLSGVVESATDKLDGLVGGRKSRPGR